MRLLAVAAAFLVVVACDSTPTETFTAETIVGVWNLSTWNGVVVPAVITGSGANRFEVVSGKVTFIAGGTFTHQLTTAHVVNGVTTLEPGTQTGTYTVSADSVRMTLGVSMQPATLSGNTMTVAAGDVTAKYQRQ